MRVTGFGCAETDAEAKIEGPETSADTCRQNGEKTKTGRKLTASRTFSNMNREKYMRQEAIVALVLCMTFGQCAFSGELAKDYDPAETRCSIGDDNVIATLLSQIDTIDKLLPSVPPEEQHYLDREDARASKLVFAQTPNTEKFKAGDRLYNELSLRPYYALWHLRRTIEPARLALRRITKREPHPENGDADFVTYQHNPEAEKVDRASRAIYPLGQFTYELSRYVDIKASTLTTEEINRFSSARGMMEMNLGFFISCKVAKAMGRQPLL